MKLSDGNPIVNITSGTTSSEAEKKYVYTISSEAASMYFSCENTNKKGNLNIKIKIHSSLNIQSK